MPINPVALPKTAGTRSTAPQGLATYREAIAAVEAAPRNKAVALEALAVSEELFHSLPSAMRKDVEFVAQAAVRNPALVNPKWQNQYARNLLAPALSADVLKAVLQRPEVQAALRKQEQALASAPDLDPRQFSINRPLLTSLIQNRLTAPQVDARPLAVVVSPKDDWNGQFSSIDALEKLSGRYKVMFFNVGTDKEFASALKASTQGKPAEFVLVGGHGEQKLAAFGADDPARLSAADRKKLEDAHLPERQRAALSAQLAKSNEEKYLDFSDSDLLRPLRDRVAPGANVVLMSCSTGKGGAKAKNLATYLHQEFPQARVHAPTEPVPNSGVIVDKSGRFLRAGFADVGKALVLEPANGSKGWGPR